MVKKFAEVKEMGMDTLEQNSTFHHYTIIEKIGQGGMSIVYKAYDNRLNRIVALKIMSSSNNPQTLVHEASLMAGIDHLNIIKIFDIGTNPCFYFSMEYIPGQTLYNWIIQNGDASSEDHLNILLQIANAVDEIHKNNIVHRDIKPSNILITTDKTIKLMDFGIAKVSKKSDIKTKKQLTPVGSPGYMAPEQISGNFSHKSDIYGIGSTLYHVICGRPPFYGGQAVNIMYEVLTKEPQPPHQLNPYISKELEAICLKCMQKAPEKRYVSVRQLIRDLKNMQQGQAIIAKKYTYMETVKKFLIFHKLAVSASVLIFCFTIFFVISQYNLTQSQQNFILLLNQEKKKTELLVTELEKEKKQTAELMDASLQSLEYAFVHHKTVQADNKFTEPIRQTFSKLEEKQEIREKIKESNSTYQRLYSIAFGLSKNPEDINNGLRIADEAIAENPLNSNVYLVKANLLHNIQRYEEAITLFKKAIYLDKTNSSAYIGLANAYKQMNSMHNSLEMYNKALDLEKNNANIYYNRALLMSKINKAPDAIKDYTTAIQIDPLYFTAFNNRGVLFQKTGNHIESLNDFNAALSIKQNYWEALANRGNTYLNLKEYHAAISDYTQVIQENLYLSILYERRALAYEQIHDFAKALRDYNMLLEKDPNQKDLHYNISNAYNEMGNFAEALQHINIFIRERARLAKGYYLRGKIHENTNDILMARKDYARAIELKHPESSTIKKRLDELK